MATAYTSDNTESAQARLGLNRVYTIWEAATALIINDTCKGPKLPKGALITDGKVSADDLDTGTTITITLRVTDGTTPKNLFTDSTVGQAATMQRADEDPGAAIGYKIPNANYWLELLVSAAPTGGGTGTIYFDCDFIYAALMRGD